jgi:hypothetical protein
MPAASYKHVDAGHGGQCGVDAVLATRLHVGQLGIGHASGRAGWQVVVLAHLGASGRNQRLLAGPARHGTGTQVGHERPRPPDCLGTGHQRVDIGKPGQAFRHRLHHRTGQRSRRRGPCLRSRQQQHRHAAVHGHFKTAAGVFGPFHRRHNETVGLADKRALAPFVFAACHNMQHLQAFAHMVWLDHRGADMLGGACDAGIQRVHVQVAGLHHVPRHHRALEEMNVLAGIDNAGRVIQVDQQRVPVGFCLWLDDVHRSTRRTEMHLRAPRLQVMFRVAGEKRKAPGANGQRVLDQRTGKPQPAVIAQCTALGPQNLHARWNGVGNTHLLKHVQRGMVDLVQVRFFQGFVLACCKAWTDRTCIARNGLRPDCFSGFAPTPSPGCFFHCRHGR